MSTKQALESFISSPEFQKAVIDSTKAGFGGSGYSVELFDNGTFRTLWDNQIGNKYNTPGIILAIPQLYEDWADFIGTENESLIETDTEEETLRANFEDAGY